MFWLVCYKIRIRDSEYKQKEPVNILLNSIFPLLLRGSVHLLISAFWASQNYVHWKYENERTLFKTFNVKTWCKDEGLQSVFVCFVVIQHNICKSNPEVTGLGITRRSNLGLMSNNLGYFRLLIYPL